MRLRGVTGRPRRHVLGCIKITQHLDNLFLKPVGEDLWSIFKCIFEAILNCACIIAISHSR